VAGAEGLVAGARDDRHPQVGIGVELVERRDQLLVRHGMAGVVDLRAIDRDDHQPAVGLDLAVLAHGIPSSCGYERRFTAGRVARRYKMPPPAGTKKPRSRSESRSTKSKAPDPSCPALHISPAMPALRTESAFLRQPFRGCRLPSLTRQTSTKI